MAHYLLFDSGLHKDSKSKNIFQTAASTNGHRQPWRWYTKMAAGVWPYTDVYYGDFPKTLRSCNGSIGHKHGSVKSV